MWKIICASTRVTWRAEIASGLIEAHWYQKCALIEYLETRRGRDQNILPHCEPVKSCQDALRGLSLLWGTVSQAPGHFSSARGAWAPVVPTSRALCVQNQGGPRDEGQKGEARIWESGATLRPPVFSLPATVGGVMSIKSRFLNPMNGDRQIPHEGPARAKRVNRVGPWPR
ncbi:MAG: hypothetical protein CM15mP103_12860 [Gammaproteobacteria bacterium]|nr:MAG: hypothetical protein CM15mP103_12860 [Gammaproteobacteria bacterium]